MAKKTANRRKKRVKKESKASPEFYNSQGMAKAKEGNPKAAFEYYEKAIQLKPDYTDAYMNRAELYKLLKKYQDAIEDYTSIIKYDPKYYQAYIERGWVKFLS